MKGLVSSAKLRKLILIKLKFTEKGNAVLLVRGISSDFLNRRDPVLAALNFYFNIPIQYNTHCPVVWFVLENTWVMPSDRTSLQSLEFS